MPGLNYCTYNYYREFTTSKSTVFRLDIHGSKKYSNINGAAKNKILFTTSHAAKTNQQQIA